MQLKMEIHKNFKKLSHCPIISLFIYYLFSECLLRGVSKVTVHDTYMKNNKEGSCIKNCRGIRNERHHDIALLKLKKNDRLKLTTYTPACLAKSSDRDSFDNVTATVAGWGLLKDLDQNNPRSLEPRRETDVPHHVQLKVVPFAHLNYHPSFLMAYDDGEPQDNFGDLNVKGPCSVRLFT